MQGSIAAAQSAADAALKSANAAEMQIQVMAEQTDALKKEHEINRLQFLVTHRPRLRIRHVNLFDVAGFFDNPSLYKDGVEIKGGLVVVNIGGTKAEIVESRYRIILSQTGLPTEAPYDERFSVLLMQGQTLNVGESCATRITEIFRLDPPRTDSEIFGAAFGEELWKFYVMGQIRYRDDGGVQRFMGFCRERGKDRRFRPVDDADYEYED